MIILVTGCAGFIGSALVERLLSLSYRVIGLDNFMTGYRQNIEPYLSHKNFVFYEEDIRNISRVRKIISDEGITHISHQAARGSVPKSIEDPILTTDINVMGTLNILWLAKETGVKRVVCAISSSVYGDTAVLPKTEDMFYNPISPYAISKVIDEMFVKQFYTLYGLETIGLRYFNVYGRRQDPNGPYAAVIPRWIFAAINNDPLLLNGTGEQTRDFTYIDDVVEANILALTSENSEAFGKGMNICFGNQIHIRDIAKAIIEYTGTKSKLVYSNEKKGDIQDSFGDYSLAKKLIGYIPNTSVEVGIQETLTWYRRNGNYFLN